VETSYGSTDLRFFKDGQEIFIITKITRDDIAKGFIPMCVDTANPYVTRKLAETDLVYRLQEKK
jgi:hypothetical protein